MKQNLQQNKMTLKSGRLGLIKSPTSAILEHNLPE